LYLEFYFPFLLKIGAGPSCNIDLVKSNKTGITKGAGFWEPYDCPRARI